MTPTTIEQLRLNFADTINRAAFGHERIILSRHGKPVAAIVPLEDMQLLEQLENEADLQAAFKARKEGGKPISLEDVAKKLNIQLPRKTKSKSATKTKA